MQGKRGGETDSKQIVRVQQRVRVKQTAKLIIDELQVTRMYINLVLLLSKILSVIMHVQLYIQTLMGC